MTWTAFAILAMFLKWCDIDVFGTTLPSLLMRLFGLNHRWRCFLDFWFFMFWMVFIVLCFSGFFHSWIYHRQLCDSFANLSGPIFLPFFWGLLTIVCGYMRWSPHIGQAMRCIVQVYTHLCRWSICWSSVPLLRFLAHTHRHDLCIHHALCVDHI